MSLATERLVVQLTAEDKRLFTEKARAMNLTLSALVRRAVLDHDASSGSNSLPQLASRVGSQQLSIDSLNDRLNALEAQLSGQPAIGNLT
jgi:SpoU rRNA methylase family enzyme